MGRPKNWTNREVLKLEAAMEIDPPYIQWRRKTNGVLVAVDVYDPHVDHPYSRNLGKTVCVNGHEYTPENTVTYANGFRDCRECKRARNREYEARKRGAA